MIHDLFPQPVGVYKLNRSFTDDELSFIKNQETRNNVNNLISLNTKILNSERLDSLKEFSKNCLSDYFNTVYNPLNEVNLKITQSWCNYTSFGQSHHVHTHPNSFVSGVFYIQVDKEVDKIYFHRSEFQQMQVLPKEWNSWNSKSWWLPVEVGDLLLFPSSLQHSVDTIKEDQTRISISFNTFPVGTIGFDLDVTELTIQGV